MQLGRDLGEPSGAHHLALGRAPVEQLGGGELGARLHLRVPAPILGHRDVDRVQLEHLLPPLPLLALAQAYGRVQLEHLAPRGSCGGVPRRQRGCFGAARVVQHHWVAEHVQRSVLIRCGSRVDGGDGGGGGTLQLNVGIHRRFVEQVGRGTEGIHIGERRTQPHSKRMSHRQPSHAGASSRQHHRKL